MDWLRTEDSYIPKEDKDAFIDKSILSLLQLMTKMRRANDLQGNKGLYLLHPISKLLVTLILIIIISLSRKIGFVFGLGCILSVLLFSVDRVIRKRIFLLSLTAALFAAMIVLPSFFMGNKHHSLLIISKVMITAACVNIFSLTTKWHDITKALKLLYIPDIFIFILDITLRYIFLFAELSLEMLYGLKLKAVGKNHNKNMAIPKLMGNLFLKSKEAGDELYAAMECRGFTGEYRSILTIDFSRRDWIAIVVLAVIIGLYFVFGR